MAARDGGGVGEDGGFAQLTVVGREDGGRGRGIRTTDGGWPGRRSGEGGRGFAQLMVAGRDDGGVGEKRIGYAII